MGGRINGTFVQNYDPKKGEYRAIGYILPIRTPKNVIQMTYNHNQFGLGGEFVDSGIGGLSQMAGLFWEHYFSRNRVRSLYTTIGFNREEAITFEDNAQLNLDGLTPLRLGITYVGTYPRFKAYTKITLKYSHAFNNFLGAMGNDSVTSSRQGGTGEFASGKFDKTDLEGTYIKTVFTNQSWLFRVNAQYTQNLLTSLEQFSMGGINSVRAYPASEYLTDIGFYTSFEWIVPAPFFSTKRIGKYAWGQIIQLSGFFDYAQGWLVQPFPNTGITRVTLSGYGIGIQIGLPNTFIGTFQIAKTFDKSVLPSDDKGTRYWFYLYYTFH